MAVIGPHAANTTGPAGWRLASAGRPDRAVLLLATSALADTFDYLIDRFVKQAKLTAALELRPQSLATMPIIPLQMRMVYEIGRRGGRRRRSRRPMRSGRQPSSTARGGDRSARPTCRLFARLDDEANRLYPEMREQIESQAQGLDARQVLAALG